MKPRVSQCQRGHVGTLKFSFGPQGKKCVYLSDAILCLLVIYLYIKKYVPIVSMYLTFILQLCFKNKRFQNKLKRILISQQSQIMFI